MSVVLEEVRKVGERELLLLWTDNRRFLIPFKELRFHCPCAACIDEHTGARILRSENIPENIHPLDWKWVGNYAIQFRWSDGHTTGIYAFDYLHRLVQA